MKPILPGPPPKRSIVTGYYTLPKNINPLTTGPSPFYQPHPPTTMDHKVTGDTSPQPQLDLDAFATIATTVSPLPLTTTTRRPSTHHVTTSTTVTTEGHGDHSPSTSSSSEKKKTTTTTRSPRRRRTHNECERKRRDSIRLSFANLQARLPHSSFLDDNHDGHNLTRDNKKHNTGEMSKMQVLTGAVERIKALKESIVQVNGEVDMLRKEINSAQKKFNGVGLGHGVNDTKLPSPTRTVILTGEQ